MSNNFQITHLRLLPYLANFMLNRSKKKHSHNKAYSALGAEYLFTLLPFIVSGIVFSSRGEYSKLIHASEWSLAAAVLIGQSLVKFISGMLANKTVFNANWERVAFGVSFLIVLALAPSLVVLCLVLTASEVSFWLSAWQIFMFILGTSIFFLFGAGGETLMRIKEDTHE